MRKEGTLSMRKRRYIYFITLIIGLLFTACSRPGQSGTNTQLPDYDWQTKGFVVGNTAAAEGIQTTQALTDETPLYPTDYKAIENVMPENRDANSASFVTDGSNIYVNNKYFAEESWHNVVWKVDGEGSISLSMSITEDMWGIKNGKVEGMDVLNPEQYVFWVASDIQEDEKGYRYAGHFYAIYTDADGKEQRRTDLIDFLKEQNLWKGYGNAVTYSGNQISCDSQGNIYLYDWERRAMYLLDPEGELLTSYIYQQTGADNFIYSLRADSGEEILVCKSDRGTEFIWLDPESRQVKNLAVAERFDNVLKWYGLWGDTLYYATRSQIIGWNVAVGERKIQFGLDENEILNTNKTCFLKTEEGAELLVAESGQRYLLTLSTEKPKQQGSLQVVNISGTDNTFLQGRVISFARENPLCGVEYINYYEEADVDRVLIEMANGKGPAVVYLSREDMENLQKKGALANLMPLLNADNMEALLPGAVAAGSFDGGLFGLPVTIYRIDTVYTSRNYWQKNTWTIGDVMLLLKQHSELRGLFMDGSADYFQNMTVLLRWDLEHSPFIDEGKCSFDSEEFQELLYIVKTRGNAREVSSGSVSEDFKLIREGEILGARECFFCMEDFCYLKEIRDGESCQVGFPSELGNGNYLDIQGILVVNQNAADGEEIRQLLNYLFCLESQQRIKDQISVRLDVPESLVTYSESLKRYVINNPYENSVRYRLAEDYNETYLREYIDLLETAMPAPVFSIELFHIIWEEAEPYFYSDKSVEAVCDAIQRRAQLYLDERN